MDQDQWSIGVDIGGTKVDVAAVDRNGLVLHSKRFLTLVEEGPKAIIHQISSVIRDMQNSMSKRPDVIGIGVAGQVDSINGLVHLAPNLHWRDVPLGEQLSSLSGIPVVVANDVRVQTWGEWRYGSGRGCEDVVCLFFGTGVGGGVISNGQLMSGSCNSAGELGHMIIDFNGPACSCGSWGCLEAHSSGWALTRRAEEMIRADPSAGARIQQIMVEQNKTLSASVVIEAFRTGDHLAMEVVEKALEAAAAGCISIVNMFNPSCLILGGGLLDGLPELILRVDQAIRERALPIASASLQVLPSQLKRHAGVIGAATFALEFHVIGT